MSRGGRALLAELGELTGDAREAAIVAMVDRGEVPAFLREWVPVYMELPGASEGRTRTATVRVSPDYVGVGTVDDFVRLPVWPATARAIGERLGGVLLPTRKIVDATWQQADVRLAPSPLPPGPAMEATATWGRHNATIEAQLRGTRRGALVAGSKKDLVTTPLLLRAPGRVAIYGWHQLSGRPIQPLSTIHASTYSDYSHGWRMVAPSVLVDGRGEVLLEDMLGDPELAPFVSDEGAFAPPRAPRGNGDGKRPRRMAAAAASAGIPWGGLVGGLAVAVGLAVLPALLGRPRS